jgi:hypothetical protein
MIQLKGCRVSKEEKNIREFKVSYGWVRHFTARHDFSIGNQTTIAQRLLETYREKLVSSQKYVLKLRKQQEYLLGKAMLTRPWYFLTCQNPQRQVNSAN